MPTEADLAAAGLYSTSVASFGSAGSDALGWLAANLTGTADVGHLLSRAAQLFGAAECRDESIGVGSMAMGLAPTRAARRRRLRLAQSMDARPRGDGPQRVELLGQRCRGRRSWLGPSLNSPVNARRCAYPEGWSSTRSIRRVVAASDSPPPAPWSAAGEFRTWLAPRYWRELHEQRRDLWAAFPDPEQRSAAGLPAMVSRGLHVR